MLDKSPESSEAEGFRDLEHQIRREQHVLLQIENRQVALIQRLMDIRDHAAGRCEAKQVESPLLPPKGDVIVLDGSEMIGFADSLHSVRKNTQGAAMKPENPQPVSIVASAGPAKATWKPTPAASCQVTTIQMQVKITGGNLPTRPHLARARGREHRHGPRRASRSSSSSGDPDLDEDHAGRTATEGGVR